MRITVDCSGKNVQGYEALKKITSQGGDYTGAIMVRFSYNRFSVSFTLIEREDKYVQYKRAPWVTRPMHIIKMKCSEPTVKYEDYGSCCPGISGLHIYSGDEGKLNVYIENYATIICEKIVARVEEYSPESGIPKAIPPEAIMDED